MSTVSASNGSCYFAVDDFLQHLRLADRELVALAAHVLDQDGQVQFAATEHPKHVRLGGVLDAQGDVALQFAVQPLADLAAGDVLALAPGQRRSVDLESHRQRGLIDLIGGRPSGCCDRRW